MRKQLFSLVAFSLSIAACSGQTTTAAAPDLGADFGSFNGAQIQLAEQGGIAALSSNRVARHDDRYFLYVQRQLCAVTCPAPLDSAMGALSGAAADSLFGIVLAQNPLSFQSDYGATRGGADMVTYTMRVAIGSTTKTITADDGTMPAAMRRIVEAVHGILAAARK